MQQQKRHTYAKITICKQNGHVCKTEYAQIQLRLMKHICIISANMLKYANKYMHICKKKKKPCINMQTICTNAQICSFKICIKMHFMYVCVSAVYI